MTTQELLITLTKNKELTSFKDPQKRNYFTLSEKQFKWLWGVFASENINADSRFGVTVTDDQGNSWGINWNDFIWHMPHYIKNREKYGKTYYISFYKANEKK